MIQEHFLDHPDPAVRDAKHPLLLKTIRYGQRRSLKCSYLDAARPVARKPPWLLAGIRNNRCAN